MNANTNTNTNSVAIGNTDTRFLPMIGKTGKVSATSEKVALVLNNVNKDGLTALARDGKGAIGAQARKAVLGSAFGLPQIRVATRLERDQWGNALSLLVGEYGPQYLNRATMRGRDGTVAYLQAVERAALVRFDGAETPVQQERAMQAVNAVRTDIDVIQNQGDFFRSGTDFAGFADSGEESWSGCGCGCGGGGGGGGGIHDSPLQKVKR